MAIHSRIFIMITNHPTQNDFQNADETEIFAEIPEAQHD